MLTKGRSTQANLMVGAVRFELTTPCAQGRCATGLRYAPTSTAHLILAHRARVMHSTRPLPMQYIPAAFPGRPRSGRGSANSHPAQSSRPAAG
jgi:hypothetical protein